MFGLHEQFFIDGWYCMVHLRNGIVIITIKTAEFVEADLHIQGIPRSSFNKCCR